MWRGCRFGRADTTGSRQKVLGAKNLVTQRRPSCCGKGFSVIGRKTGGGVGPRPNGRGPTPSSGFSWSSVSGHPQQSMAWMSGQGGTRVWCPLGESLVVLVP
ncbi:hypothetical protein GCM10010350_71570 [Streptomyces galilaeus]|nr:hypothetical protein GCM10010350_71570 [Streptomyces galilaeus]